MLFFFNKKLVVAMKRPLARLVLGFLGVQLVVAGFLLGQFVESFLEPAPLMMVSARRAGGLNRMASAAAAATEAAAAAAAAASDAKSKDGGEPEEAQARALKAQQLAGDDRLLLQPRKRNEFLPPSGHNRLHGADESIDNGPRFPHQSLLFLSFSLSKLGSLFIFFICFPFHKGSGSCSWIGI
jgi:hypothetical protein